MGEPKAEGFCFNSFLQVAHPAGHLFEQPWMFTGLNFSKMAISEFGHFAATRGSHEVTLLDEKGLVNLFDGD